MKKYLIFLGLAGVSLLQYCKKNGGDSPVEIPDIPPVVTEKGTPQGTAKTASIGTSGGSITSEDGRLTVTIPAGAFTSTTTVGIQPLSNNSPMGMGSAYRITPEGVTFSKPVTITFRYDVALLGSVIEDFLWITSQQSNGTWVGYRKSVVNTTDHSVAVEATHFSDWSMARFIDLALTPVATSVMINKNVGLTVAGFLKERDEEELVPLSPISTKQVPINSIDEALAKTERFLAFTFTGWALNGSNAPVSNSNGKLVADAQNAIYTAPSKAPNPNKVAVSVSLETMNKDKSRSKYMLVSTITVIEGELYLHLVVDGGEDYYYYQYGLNGQIPSDPNKMQMVNCGLGSYGELGIAGSYIDGSNFYNRFTVAFGHPAVGVRPFLCFNSSQSNDDDMSFMPTSDLVQPWSNAYIQRTKTANDCKTEPLCAETFFRLTQYSSQPGSEVTGEFIGYLYKDLPGFSNSCTTPEKHRISGDFRLVKVN